jgi:hypothetical protein
MLSRYRHLVWLWIAVLAACPLAAVADDTALLGDRTEAILDIDGDGKLDRAVLTRHPDGGTVDIAIYLGGGAGKLDPSATPSFLRTDLADWRILGFERKGKGSLLITYGCGGCSNDFSTTLTVVYRRGEFLVGGVTYEWDTRYSVGRCDVNLLTGKGVLSFDLARDRAIKASKGRFAPIKLAEWTGEWRPEECDR